LIGNQHRVELRVVFEQESSSGQLAGKAGWPHWWQVSNCVEPEKRLISEFKSAISIA